MTAYYVKSKPITYGAPARWSYITGNYTRTASKAKAEACDSYFSAECLLTAVERRDDKRENPDYEYEYKIVMC